VSARRSSRGSVRHVSWATSCDGMLVGTDIAVEQSADATRVGRSTFGLRSTIATAGRNINHVVAGAAIRNIARYHERARARVHVQQQRVAQQHENDHLQSPAGNDEQWKHLVVSGGDRNRRLYSLVASIPVVRLGFRYLG
jgi:hypothetical protein